MNIVYERINDLCKENGTSYNAVCNTIGIKPARIGNLRSREYSVPQANVVLALARYFNVSPEYILGETDDRGQAEQNKNPATESDGQISEYEKAVMNASERERQLIMRILKWPEDRQDAFLIMTQDVQNDQ